jgi:hypothetical protein
VARGRRRRPAKRSRGRPITRGAWRSGASVKKAIARGSPSVGSPQSVAWPTRSCGRCVKQ